VTTSPCRAFTSMGQEVVSEKVMESASMIPRWRVMTPGKLSMNTGGRHAGRKDFQRLRGRTSS